MRNYKKDKSYIKQRLEYVSPVDYISELEEQIENLQEENERFKKYVKDYFKSKLDRKNEELELVKNKLIEEHNKVYKAIEYVNNHQLVFELSSKKQIQYWFDKFYKNLLNILNGGDDNGNKF